MNCDEHIRCYNSWSRLRRISYLSHLRCPTPILMPLAASYSMLELKVYWYQTLIYYLFINIMCFIRLIAESFLLISAASVSYTLIWMCWPVLVHFLFLLFPASGTGVSHNTSTKLRTHFLSTVSAVSMLLITWATGMSM